NEAIWIVVRQCAKQVGIQHTEHGRVGPYAEGHGQHGDVRETCISPKRPQCVLNISQNVMTPPHSSRIAAFLFAFADRTHCAHGSVSGVFRTEAGSDSFVDLEFQVMLKLFVKFAVDSPGEDCSTKEDVKTVEPSEHLLSPYVDRCDAVRTIPEIAADSRSQLADSSVSALRPLRVS